MGLPAQTRRGGMAAGLARPRPRFGVWRALYPSPDAVQSPGSPLLSWYEPRESAADARLEVVGQARATTTLQELFFFRFDGEAPGGSLPGRFVSSGLRPDTFEKARRYGLEQTYLEACL
ncbi:hypothetical protein E6W36_03300 [Hankyongella ginsenosidimutans]|uniref:Uncharacterized protein n=1 Tax=Hankyongella ginsenosidimutans TaxID=1763828 RepID=A0A4D7C767_9SPHN|nr:hypothetical protein [Hankyongella ginsenosidimutans]QCI78968.1 hypothetical protein E6W36_03300 [Hankyongella ginsenosidimutans]